MEGTEKNLELRKFINQKNREKLKNLNLSIIASNCNGALLLHDLGLRFNSPTVNLFMYPKDFIKYVKNLREYSNKKLIFIELENIDYPVAKLDDIIIYFMHYKSEEEAANKWYERTTRINYDNIFIMMAERDGCTYQDLIEFDNLKYQNKIVFTHKEYKNIKSSFYIKGFENDEGVGLLYKFKNDNTGEKYYDEFDYISWLNGERK